MLAGVVDHVEGKLGTDVTHQAYERIRNPLTTDEEREELKEFQQEVCGHIQVPNGALDIPGFKKDGF